jgi:dimethylglycine dehydrogenase
VGTVTSGDWGHRVGQNLAYAFIDPALAGEGTHVQIDMYGDLVDARVIPASPYDPEHARMRA